MQTVTVLGATGSIGCNTLDVIARHPDKYRVFAITGNSQIEKLLQQAKACACRYVVIADESRFQHAKHIAEELNIQAEILCGERYMNDVASAPEVDIVMAAIVGAAGLNPTLAAVNAGKRVLLANKESLVMSGALFIQAANESNAEILPIDSEHNAIFQCLPSHAEYGDLQGVGISQILLTGSGGPFRDRPLETFSTISPDEACAHPNWSMGRKISVDSATMMNKGLEFIEACWLFGAKAEDITVVLHPQSTIHSMVQYVDGSVIAQMGNPDMRTPIAHGLAYPERIDAGVAALDFSRLADFTFSTPCETRFPNLYLAIEACQAGQSRTTQLNAANEIAVEAFLNERIRFDQIETINKETLQRLEPTEICSLQQVLEEDRNARDMAEKIVREIS
ncbi:1-deoxy-D-xylulose-5-phosphate reductoisomerase [Alteromonas sediminis]|uniref:1-deoxy-D-xylulose 5-phosphate reductoisomerase n=1 Tax=Alteromonas sediminis TaxID=2259342 RepID=A0A3N5YA75_9ALTE|nr:1-deoxy-D-xylulose-5-phosphate reductoisomerase [Alteromonas sediminis]RPJ68369.1 1-deoxy-D-xylulose-5-phosphate reductoisomerase [Alteromonas sediminis]